jgi:hypothetical protein
MAKSDQLIGQKFSKLTVIGKTETPPNLKWADSYWLCECECGSDKITKVSAHNLKTGVVKSCGCYRKEAKAIWRKKKMEEMEDITGQIFGNLTVIAPVGLNMWECKCSCGNEENVISRITDLKNGKIKSCGCFRRKRLQYGENAFNRLLHSYKHRKDVPFELTKDEFSKLTKSNCYYCNQPPAQIAKPTIRSYGEYIYNGIDRIDSSKGYTTDNCVPCCGFCNVSKNNHSLDNFLKKVKTIYENLNL